MYNVKIIYFPNGEIDVRTYKNPIVGFSPDDRVSVPDVSESLLKPDLNRSKIVSLNRTKNTIYDYSRSNNWELFITILFDSKKIDRYNYDEITKKLSQQFKNIKKRKAKDLKYLLVPELHKDGAIHFHGLLSNFQGLTITKAINQKKESKHYGKFLKDKTGKQVYNIQDFNLGFSTATKVTDTKKASNYICKYITKDLFHLTEGKKRYWNSKNLDKPKIKTDYYSPDELEELILSIKKMDPYHREVRVENHSYENIINYFTINNN